MARPRHRVIPLVIVGTLAACAAPETQAPTSERSPAEAATPVATSSATASPDVALVEGVFDVGGHRLYMRCEGEGSPTVVYMHGSITESPVVPHRNALHIQGALREDYRVCVYDRRNLGRSDTVDAAQTPTNAITDMRNLLAAAEIDPPYVLLGASFGGLLAYLYANTYPDEVVAMVQLDSPFPDEMTIEHLIPPDMRYGAFHEDDEQNSLERISHFTAHQDAVPFIGREPEIPLTYFASLQEPDYATGVAEYDAQAAVLQQAYVDRFSPGTFIEVDSPHFMEPAIPDEIVQALRDVIAEAGY